ncbi:MAG: hypothetical protein JXX14_10675 [Deltaproteobacteria bacterium]|nr:hypothetical protein [Deltaproteobacteria bacterium]
MTAGKLLYMERKIRISEIDKQDELRRADTLKMSPAERIAALVRLRDRMFPYQPIERIITVRHFR